MTSKISVLCSGVLALGVLVPAVGGFAQIVSPVPAKPEPTREFTPPEPAPAPPPAAAPETAQPAQPAPEPEPEIPAIDLVKKDAAGKIIPLTAPAEEVAVEEVLKHLKGEAADKLRKLIEDRRAAAENAVARNATAALNARSQLAGLEEIKGMRELSSVNTEMLPAKVKPELIDMAQQLRVMTPKQIKIARDALKAYRDAYTKSSSDVEPMIRLNVRFNAIEPMRALDDLLVRLADKWSDVRGGIGLTDDQTRAIAAAEKAFGSAPAGKAKSDALAAILKQLSSQQASTALLMVAATMPEGLPVAPPTAPKVKPVPTKAKPAPADAPDAGKETKDGGGK